MEMNFSDVFIESKYQREVNQSVQNPVLINNFNISITKKALISKISSFIENFSNSEVRKYSKEISQIMNASENLPKRITLSYYEVQQSEDLKEIYDLLGNIENDFINTLEELNQDMRRMSEQEIVRNEGKKEKLQNVISGIRDTIDYINQIMQKNSYGQCNEMTNVFSLNYNDWVPSISKKSDLWEDDEYLSVFYQKNSKRKVNYKVSVTDNGLELRRATSKGEYLIDIGLMSYGNPIYDIAIWYLFSNMGATDEKTTVLFHAWKS